MNAEQQERAPAREPVYVVEGQKVALGLFTPEMVDLWTRWMNDFEVTRTLGPQAMTVHCWLTTPGLTMSVDSLTQLARAKVIHARMTATQSGCGPWFQITFGFIIVAPRLSIKVCLAGGKPFVVFDFTFPKRLASSALYHVVYVN